MAFQVGNKLSNGRPAGSKNKNSETVRKKFLELVQNNINQIEQDLEGLAALERIQVIIQLSKFVLPTLKSTNVQTEFKEQRIFNIINYDEENPDFQRISKELENNY